MGADGRRFRINITGVEQGAVRSARRQAETIDFDITSVILNPLYANPSSSGVLEMILRKDERIARLSFMGRKDIIKFQQAVTGFKAFDNYCQYNTMLLECFYNEPYGNSLHVEYVWARSPISVAKPTETFTSQWHEPLWWSATYIYTTPPSWRRIQLKKTGCKPEGTVSNIAVEPAFLRLLP
ncbi:hypothetical protein K4K61_011311 [Colletotrichum sp. SAR11_59]|nr:hypothetical protein K4K61_011311 [Colletotrichum sp. SAR11_59]